MQQPLGMRLADAENPVRSPARIGPVTIKKPSSMKRSLLALSLIAALPFAATAAEDVSYNMSKAATLPPTATAMAMPTASASTARLRCIRISTFSAATTPRTSITPISMSTSGSWASAITTKSRRRPIWSPAPFIRRSTPAAVSMSTATAPNWRARRAGFQRRRVCDGWL